MSLLPHILSVAIISCGECSNLLCQLNFQQDLFSFLFLFCFFAFIRSSYAFAHTSTHTYAVLKLHIRFVFFFCLALTPNTVASRQATAALTTDAQAFATVFVGVQPPTWQKLARICQLHVIQYLNYYIELCVCVCVRVFFLLAQRGVSIPNKLIN